MKRCGGLREVQGVRHGDKVPQMTEFHTRHSGGFPARWQRCFRSIARQRCVRTRLMIRSGRIVCVAGYDTRMNRTADGGLSQGWWTRERLMTVTLFILTVLLLYGCYRIARPFLTTLTLAIAIAVAAFPLHRWVARRIKARSLAAGATLLLVMIVIVAPAFFIGQQVAREAAKGVEQIRANLTPENWEQFQREHPRVGGIVDRIEREVNLRDTLQQAAGAVSGVALSAV